MSDVEKHPETETYYLIFQKIMFKNQSYLTTCIHFSFRYKGNLVVNGQTYGPWSDWSDCSVEVGQGVMTRSRDCIVADCPDPGEYLGYMVCFVKPCACECPLASGKLKK